MVEIMDSRFELKLDELVEAESCVVGKSNEPPSRMLSEILPDPLEWDR